VRGYGQGGLGALTGIIGSVVGQMTRESITARTSDVIQSSG
jgi:hypothetical protein